MKRWRTRKTRHLSMFHVFEGVEELQGQRTCKTRPDSAFYLYEGEGMGQRGTNRRVLCVGGSEGQ